MIFKGTRSEIRFTVLLFAFIFAGACPFILHVAGKLLNVWPTNLDGAADKVSYSKYAVVIWLSLASLTITMSNIGVWTSFFLRTRQRVKDGGVGAEEAIDAFSVLMSYCFAATLGGLLLFIFAGGLVKGSLFPDFRFESSSLFTLRFVGEDWCKLIVWAFLAGFSERLIPQFLDDLAGRFGRTSEHAP